MMLKLCSSVFLLCEKHTYKYEMRSQNTTLVILNWIVTYYNNSFDYLWYLFVYLCVILSLRLSLQ